MLKQCPLRPPMLGHLCIFFLGFLFLLLGACATSQNADSNKNLEKAGSQPTNPANIKFYSAPFPEFGSVERLSPKLDAILPPDAKAEKLAEGFDWSEGPVWVPEKNFLLFSDIPPNMIYKWSPKESALSVFMQPAGYHGDREDLAEPGTNGLAIDAKGNLIMCQHGNRRLASLNSWAQPFGKQSNIVDKYRGKKLNSPNDLVLHSSGDIFFTDPPYGLAKRMNDPDKELDFQGVYRFIKKTGELKLLTKSMERPNGINLSPDEKTLYVANSFSQRPVIMAYPLNKDLSLGEGKVLVDNRNLPEEKYAKGTNDGMAIAQDGTIFASRYGGVFIFDPKGKHLGTIRTGEATGNCTFGEDGKTLFIVADMYLLRVRTAVKGLGFK